MHKALTLPGPACPTVTSESITSDLNHLSSHRFASANDESLEFCVDILVSSSCNTAQRKIHVVHYNAKVATKVVTTTALKAAEKSLMTKVHSMFWQGRLYPVCILFR